MHPESAALLWDVRAAAERIGTFVSGLTQALYREDELRTSAVERQLDVLGEALKTLRSLDPETVATIPDVARIIGMRNVLAHAYAVVERRCGVGGRDGPGDGSRCHRRRVTRRRGIARR